MRGFPETARGLYAIVDPEHTRGRDPLEVADAVLDAGVAVLQLRAKAMADGPMLALAHALRRRCAQAGVPFVVNDRADVARLVDADGLHLGQDDLPLVGARKVVGSMPIGRSTHSLTQAVAAAREGHAMIGFGPVFPTATKANPDPVVGLGALAEVVRSVSIPVVAIGGITRARVPTVHAAGAAMVAAIAAVIGADDVRAAAHAMHHAARGEST